MQIEMTLSKSTKNTHVYINDAIDASIPSVYIKKVSMATPPPQTILVTFEAVDG